MTDYSKHQWETNVGGNIGSVRHGGKIGGIELDTSVLDKITANLQPKAAKIIHKWGIKMAGEWSASVPYVTTAFQQSILSESKMVAPLTYRLSDGVEYGIFVELGTHKKAARPHLVPTIEKNYQGFCEAFGELFE